MLITQLIRYGKVMSSLNFSNIPEVLFSHQLTTSTDVETYTISLQKGVSSGVSVEVSGAGAYALLEGDVKFKSKLIEKSKKYEEMQKKYKFKAGISGFIGWITGHAGGETEKTEIKTALQEMASELDTEVTAHIKLEVTGQIPGFPVKASAAVFILKIESSNGATYYCSSTEAPSDDIIAQDQKGNVLPDKNNQSSFTI